MPKKKKWANRYASEPDHIENSSGPSSTAAILQIFYRAKEGCPLKEKEVRQLPPGFLIGGQRNSAYFNDNGSLNNAGLQLLNNSYPQHDKNDCEALNYQERVLVTPASSIESAQDEEERRRRYYEAELNRYKKYYPKCRAGLLKDYERLDSSCEDDCSLKGEFDSRKREFIASELLYQYDFDVTQKEKWLTRAVELNDHGLLKYLKKQITKDNIVSLLEIVIGSGNQGSVFDFLMKHARRYETSQVDGLSTLIESLTPKEVDGQPTESGYQEMHFEDINPEVILSDSKEFLEGELQKAGFNLKPTEKFMQFLRDCYTLLQFVLPIGRFVEENPIKLLDNIFQLPLKQYLSSALEIKFLSEAVQTILTTFQSDNQNDCCGVADHGDIAIVLDRNIQRSFDCQKMLNALIMALIFMSLDQDYRRTQDVKFGYNGQAIEILISEDAITHHRINSEKLIAIFTQVQKDIFDSLQNRIIHILRLICECRYSKSEKRAEQDLLKEFDEQGVACLKQILNQTGPLFKIPFMNQLADHLDKSLIRMFQDHVTRLNGVRFRGK